MNIGDFINKTSVKPFFYQDKCDRYDYLIAVGCGAVAGLIDVFLVGAPGDSKLQTWTDSQVDKAVMGFAKMCGWKDNGKEASAIGFLEKKFPVNYDQRHTADVGGALNMSSKNHHMKSLAHSPDIVGLFFSILNQFTSTSTFLSDGKFITIKTDTFELRGSNFVSKLFCGFVNWLGHIMSDVAGSSGSVGQGGRGSGVVIPFYELFQLCDFGSFQVGQYKNTLATLATKTFQAGYDARWGLTMAIPVVLCDLSIKLIWALKHYFYHKRPLKECIPSIQHDDLRIMLLIGQGTLCLMDGADAYIRSGGNCLAFFLRLNLIAWYKFSLLVLKEICIRSGISLPLQKQLDAYIRINEALDEYLSELAKIDYARFKQETSAYKQLLERINSAHSEADLTGILKNEYRNLGIPLPYQGSFDSFMQDKSSRLEFC